MAAVLASLHCAWTKLCVLYARTQLTLTYDT